MRTSLRLPLAFSRLLGFAFAVALLLAFLHLARARDNTNESTNANATSNSAENKNASNTNRNANGNQAAGAGPSAGRSAIPCPSPEAFKDVEVTGVYKRGTKTEGVQAGVREVELGDEITLEVNQLKVLLDRAKCATPNKNVVLYLEGRPLKEVTPFPPTDPTGNMLNFPLKRTEKSRDVWTYLLGKPRFDLNPTAVSIGLEDEYAVPSAQAGTLSLRTIPTRWFIFWLLIFLLLFVAFILLATKTNLLRDVGPEPGGEDRKPYSLARSQAAWWFFIVLASYLFIGMITGDFSTTITGTVLTLLGISAGTVVGSAFVDASKATPPSSAPPAPPPGQPGQPAPPAAPAQSVRGTTSWKNDYWWQDILSDADGVSFHRFQMAAWTLVLGIIFVVQVYNALAMPDFNGTLLALLGISAGTFLGVKIPEATAPKK